MAEAGLVVVDTTVWSNFSHAGGPRQILQVFPGAASPGVVHAEILEGQRLGYLPASDWAWLPRLQLTDEETDLETDLASKLDRGEAACLAIATTRGALLLTDDRAARRLAISRDLRVSGTLGALVRLVHGGHLSESAADDQLQRMIRAGYRSPVRSLATLLAAGR